jgi:hypothetical protein
MEMVVNDAVFCQCIRQFGVDGFLRQQDNTPAHWPGGQIIKAHFKMLDSPVHSPDLSPIETVWSIIKRGSKGSVIENQNELFATRDITWNAIPQCILDTLVGSFLVPCRVCVELDAGCFNGHGRRVHEIHHTTDPVNVP